MTIRYISQSYSEHIHRSYTSFMTRLAITESVRQRVHLPCYVGSCTPHYYSDRKGFTTLTTFNSPYQCLALPVPAGLRALPMNLAFAVSCNWKRSTITPFRRFLDASFLILYNTACLRGWTNHEGTDPPQGGDLAMLWHENPVIGLTCGMPPRSGWLWYPQTCTMPGEKCIGLR